MCGPGGDQVVVMERDMMVTFVSSPSTDRTTCDLLSTGHQLGCGGKYIGVHRMMIECYMSQLVLYGKIKHSADGYICIIPLVWTWTTCDLLSTGH